MTLPSDEETERARAKEVDVSGYQRVHGCLPRGRGNWVFNVCGRNLEYLGMEYAEAEQRVLRRMQQEGNVNQVWLRG